MRYVLLAVVLLSVSPRAFAQEVVPDTLDWRLYYPLEVGNAWEWETIILIAYTGFDRRVIVADTLVDGRRYFVQAAYSTARDPLMGYEHTATGMVLLRYDTLGARVVARSLEGTEEFDYTCDLSTDFGTVTRCGEFGEMYVSGYYTGFYLGGHGSIYVAAIKNHFTAGGGTSYYHGVGMLPGIGDGAAGGREFTYVRVGGKEYGERRVIVGTEGPPGTVPARVDVYPNPLRDAFTITLDGYGGGAAVTVYDVLGRVALPAQDCAEPGCRVHAGGLASGPYLVRVVGEDGRVSEKTIVVLK